MSIDINLDQLLLKFISMFYTNSNAKILLQSFNGNFIYEYIGIWSSSETRVRFIEIIQVYVFIIPRYKYKQYDDEPYQSLKNKIIKTVLHSNV